MLSDTNEPWQRAIFESRPEVYSRFLQRVRDSYQQKGFSPPYIRNRIQELQSANPKINITNSSSSSASDSSNSNTTQLLQETPIPQVVELPVPRRPKNPHQNQTRTPSFTVRASSNRVIKTSPRTRPWPPSWTNRRPHYSRTPRGTPTYTPGSTQGRPNIPWPRKQQQQRMGRLQGPER